MSDRVSGKCGVCGLANPETLETHHIVPRRYGGTDAPENLVDLCGSCHNAVERIYDERFYERLKQAFDAPEIPESKELGHSRHSAESMDRSFPGHPLHVNRGEARIKEVLDNQWADKDAIARYLSPVPEFVLREHHGDQYPDEALEELTTPDIEALQETIPVLDCGYCNRVFLAWEASDCVKHLRIAHRVDDPYEEETTVVTKMDDLGEFSKEEVPKSHVESFEPRDNPDITSTAELESSTAEMELLDIPGSEQEDDNDDEE